MSTLLAEYGCNAGVSDYTPMIDGVLRGVEINAWLKDNPDVTQFVIIDDNFVGDGLEEHVVYTDCAKGLTRDHVYEIVEKLDA